MWSLSDPVLDRHDGTNANYEISPDNLFQALIDLCQQYYMEGLYDEHFRIAKILGIKDSERYQGSHRNICQCFCTLPNERRMLPTGPFEEILYRLWERLSFSAEKSGLKDVMGDLKASVTLCSPSGLTLLHLIAACPHPSPASSDTDFVLCIAKLLISEGCPVNAATPNGENALSLAIASGKLNLIELLVRNGASLTDPWIQMEALAREHAYDILEILFRLYKYPTSDEPSSLDEHLRSLVGEAVAVPYPERKLTHGTDSERIGKATLSLLLEQAYGNDNIPLDDGHDLLSEAILHGNSDFFVQLLGRLVQPSNALQRCGGMQHIPLLHESILRLKSEIFLYLLDHGADINLSSGTEVFPNWRPIHLAAYLIGCDPFYFDELIQRGADLSLADDKGETVLDRLITSECAVDRISVVLKKEPHLFNHSTYQLGVPILHRAVSGSSSIMAALLEAGADIRSTDEHGRTATYHAAIIATSDVLKVLLLREQKVLTSHEQATSLGTSLQCACSGGNVPAVQLLLDFGADPNFLDCGSSRTPLSCAWERRLLYLFNSDRRMTIQASIEEKKFHEVWRLLLQYGMDELKRYGPENKTAREHSIAQYKSYITDVDINNKIDELF